MASKQLIDACFMWCEIKGVKPIPLGHKDTRELVVMAVKDYDGDFAKLNERQRSMIAGLHVA